jgi:hypothetical protein
MTRHTLGTEYAAERKIATRRNARSVRAHSSHSYRRPPTLSAHTATGAKAKISERTNSVIIASALQPRLREPRSAPRITAITTKPAKQHDDLERFKAAYLEI